MPAFTVPETATESMRLRQALPPQTRNAAVLLALLTFGVWGVENRVGAQESGDSSTVVSVAGVTVDPPNPGPDTLCRLTVAIENKGDQTASQLGFDVRLNGQSLAVYGNQLFMYPVQPGEKAEVPLYNFWTTESSRPALTDGKLSIEVALVEAQWMSITEDEDGVEVWDPQGAVPGLPTSAQIDLQVTASPTESDS